MLELDRRKNKTIGAFHREEIKKNDLFPIIYIKKEMRNYVGSYNDDQSIMHISWSALFEQTFFSLNSCKACSFNSEDRRTIFSKTFRLFGELGIVNFVSVEFSRVILGDSSRSFSLFHFPTTTPSVKS
mmetsp:Transcript_14409/g.10401  ORF Transcript_14409/g.10401 Transcript_14409/m.10401 type:complete len:128 (-) Transcript_14409:177-560(-)